MIRFGAALLALLLPAAALAQQVSSPASRYSTYPFPASPFEEMHSVIIGGPYPAAAQLTPGIAGFAAKMVVPPTATQTPHPNSPISSWIISSNTTATNSSTAIIGGSFTKVDGANPFGTVMTVCNCDGFGALPGAGHDFQYQVGFEVDIESLSRAGGVAPTGQQIGYLAVSASDIQPAGGSAAFVARDQGGAGGFHYAFYSEDGAALAGAMRVGAQTMAAFAPAADSQRIEFRARTGGVTDTGVLQYQQGGNLVFSPATTRPGGVFTTTGHYGASAPAVAVSACGTSPVVGTSNDTRGIVQIGTGTVTQCTVTFGVAYAQIPACVVTNSAAGTVPGFASLLTDKFTVSFSANAAGTKFTYLCFQ